MRVTKHAPVALINKSNPHVLRNLHPLPLKHGCIKPQINTRSGGTLRNSLLHQRRYSRYCHTSTDKATGVHCDSLDIYIKAARRLDISNPDHTWQAKALAGFFNHVINGEVPEHFQTFLRQTYLIALEKDPEDKTKLLPLGVPSAIRCIAANSQYCTQGILSNFCRPPTTIQLCYWSE